MTGALAAASAGRTVVVAVTFTKTSTNKAIRDTLKWWDGESAMAHLLLTLTPKSLPVGDAKGWPELRTAAESDARRLSCHKRGGVYVQPANLDADKIVRHEDIASWAGDTKFVLFTRDAPEVARAVPRDQLHRPTTIMRGTLAYSRNRATEPMGTWWSGDTPIPISFVELPDTLDVESRGASGCHRAGFCLFCCSAKHAKTRGKPHCYPGFVSRKETTHRPQVSHAGRPA